MNAPPDALELAPLFSALSDSWKQGAGGLTYPADNPAKRIDYVLTSSQFSAVGTVVIGTTVSDHRPVLARLVLR
jgi:endonuclease/exonuclease/phosphatase family metal-dependent hydrolase